MHENCLCEQSLTQCNVRGRNLCNYLQVNTARKFARKVSKGQPICEGANILMSKKTVLSLGAAQTTKLMNKQTRVNKRITV